MSYQDIELWLKPLLINTSGFGLVTFILIYTFKKMMPAREAWHEKQMAAVWELVERQENKFAASLKVLSDENAKARADYMAFMAKQGAENVQELHKIKNELHQVSLSNEKVAEAVGTSETNKPVSPDQQKEIDEAIKKRKEAT